MPEALNVFRNCHVTPRRFDAVDDAFLLAERARCTALAVSQPFFCIAHAAISALNESDGSCDSSFVLKALVEAVDALLQVT